MYRFPLVIIQSLGPNAIARMIRLSRGG